MQFKNFRIINKFLFVFSYKERKREREKEMPLKLLFVFVDSNGIRHKIFDDIFAQQYSTMDTPLLINEISDTFREMAKRIARHWHKKGIRVSAFDFGCTITQIHWGDLQKKLPQKKEQKWNHVDMYNHPDVVRPLLIGNFNLWLVGILFDTLQKTGIEPVIVSYGNRDVEWALLRPILSNLSIPESKAKARIFTQRVGAIWDNCIDASHEQGCTLFKKVYTEYDTLHDDSNPDIHQTQFAQDMKKLIPEFKHKEDVTITNYPESQEEEPKKNVLMRAALCMFGLANLNAENSILVDNNAENIRDMKENGFRSFYVGPSTCNRPRGFLDVFLKMCK